MSLIQNIVVTEQGRQVRIVTVGTQGPPGAPGPSGNSRPAVYFNYGDATPATLYTPSSNQVITRITLQVVTTFNGTGAKVSIGTDASPELLMDDAESDLSGIAVYESTPGETIASGTAIKAFITPGSGASQGRCMVLIEYADA